MSLPPIQNSVLFTLDDLDDARQWLFKIRKKYSENSDIWDLCRDWDKIKQGILEQLNDGSYEFRPIERYEMDDGAIISLWSSQDMIALKLLTQSFGTMMAQHIPASCYHVKNHGGLKKAVKQTHAALPDYQFIFRSDIKGYYESIHLDTLMTIIEVQIKHPILLTLIRKAIYRTETRGGVFYDYHESGIPKGSPLSPLLGAIALIPLDQAMGEIKHIFYARFMDDWVVCTKSKTALRKVIKRTHQIMQDLHFQLHPMKTYIGKISHGFNFLGYYMDAQKILPSQETIRRFYERTAARYAPPLEDSPRRSHNPGRDISLYPANEAAPCNSMFEEILTAIMENSFNDRDVIQRMQQYVCQWTRWLRIGLSTVDEYLYSVQVFIPSLFSCWSEGPLTLAWRVC